MPLKPSSIAVPSVAVQTIPWSELRRHRARLSGPSYQLSHLENFGNGDKAG
jgi:hypothetical protein